MFDELQRVDARSNELKSLIANAKSAAHAIRQYEKPEVFGGWMQELQDLKLKRQRLQFEMGEIARAERRKAQEESDRLWAERYLST
jgi:hypothetical protein